MVDDDDIRAELIASISAEADGDLDWLSEISDDAQKEALTIFIEYGHRLEEEPDLAMEMFGKLAEIEEVAPHIEAMFNAEASASASHKLALKFAMKHI